MKKIILFSVLLFQMTFVFGQTSADWSSWITHDCYKGIKFKVANWGKVSGDYSDYYWGIMFQNTYSQPVSFSYNFSVGGENQAAKYNFNVTYKIEPGGIYSNDGTKATAILFKSSSTNYIISIKDVCLGSCENNSYINCQGVKQNAIKISNNSTSTNQTNSSQNQEAQRREAAENKRLTDGTKTYFEYYNKATAAGQAGNYDEAISNWNGAISTAVNDAQRKNAQEWLAEVEKAKAKATNQANYAEAQRQQEVQRKQQEEKRQQYNNTLNQASTNIQNGNYTDAMQNYTNALNSATTKSEKNLAATGAVISGVGGVFDAFAKAKEEKRERERLEQAQRELEQQQASDLMETTWKYANSFAEQKNFNQAINSMLPYMNANKLNAFSVSKIGFWYAQVKDYESAKICYDKALKLSLKCCAVHYMGDLYQYGQGVAVNYETALTYYKLSCENEDKTGCENYEKLKPIVDEAQKKEKLKKEKAIATISKFNFKPHLDYLVSQLEKQGFLFDNVTFFCTTETSKTLYVSFVKNNLNLETVLKIEYNKEINRSLSYSIDSGDRNLQVDFSKTKLSELIGNEKISNSYSNASHTISAVAPKPISLATFKNSKYKGFAIETATKSGELLANYIHNYGVSCGNNIEQIKWLTKIIDTGGNLNYYLELENLYITEGNVEKALETFKNYVSKITNQDDLNTIAEQTNAKLISELKSYHFNKLAVLADIGLGNAAFEVAKHYRKGEIIGESKSTGSNSVSYPYLKVGKNYEKSVLYFTKAFDSNFNKGEAACYISKLYDMGGNGIEKNKVLYKEWKKKSKETGYKCK